MLLTKYNLTQLLLAACVHLPQRGITNPNFFWVKQNKLTTNEVEILAIAGHTWFVWILIYFVNTGMLMLKVTAHRPLHLTSSWTSTRLITIEKLYYCKYAKCVRVRLLMAWHGIVLEFPHKSYFTYMKFEVLKYMYTFSLNISHYSQLLNFRGVLNMNASEFKYLKLQIFSF